MKYIFNLILFFSLGFGRLQASSEMILITYDDHEQMAKWLQSVISGPNINTPESLVAIKQVKNPCEAQADRLMHICIDAKASYKVVMIKTKEVEEAFAHLVPAEVHEDPVAKREWQKIWEGPNALELVDHK